MKINKYILPTVICIALLALAIYIIIPKSIPDNSGLPKYALANNKIKEAYLFAKENPEVLNGVNCYCGCMQHLHSGRIHKRGLLDCFMKENGDFEMHASQCDMCINDALQVKQMFLDGKTKEEIKNLIDSKYSHNG